MELSDKEVMEKDALNRIRWDRKLKPEEYSIMYLDRGKLREVRFTEIQLQGDFFQSAENQIPMHRIRKILRKGNVVWEKRRN
ncbi:MAG: DUF504 domain-containing protein [Candidatus Altiarchaeota archaeon]|nr:DUF504 domain-containing protein [Candidatus Altiarchaeota archaeon]